MMSDLNGGDNSKEELSKISFENLLTQCLDGYETEDYAYMQKDAQEAKLRNPYHLMAVYLSAIANSCTDHWLEAYADLRFLENLQNTYQENVISAEELQQMIMQAKEMVLQRDDHEQKEQIQQIDDRYVLLQANLFTSYKTIEGYFRPL